MHNFTWGYSSDGRAPALQAGGREFESHYLHSSKEKDKFLTCDDFTLCEMFTLCKQKNLDNYTLIIDSY